MFKREKTKRTEVAPTLQESIASCQEATSNDAGDSGDKKISAWDLLTMERGEHAMKLAHMKLQAALYEARHAEVRANLDRITRDAALNELRIHAQATAEAHKTLADSIADRYAFSWATHSYDPDTGAIQESPTEV